MMRFSPGNSQHIGARASQQDAFGYSDPENTALMSHGGLVAVVADGMGGMANGRDAARCAIRTFLATYESKSPTESIPDALMRSLLSANAAVVGMARDLRVEGEMGTTLVGVVLHGASYYSISVGDSAAYLMRRGRLYQLTVSHTHGEDLDREVARRQISQTQALNDPERHALTSFLGLERLTEIDASQEPRPLQPGDRILVCSDGLSKVLDERQIIAGLGGEPQPAAELLLSQVLRCQVPEQDNVTVLVVACEGEEEASTAPPSVALSASAAEAPAPAHPLPTAEMPTRAEAPPSAETFGEDAGTGAFDDQVLGGEPGPPGQRERTPPWSPSPKIVLPVLAFVFLLLLALVLPLACRDDGETPGSTTAPGTIETTPPPPESAASTEQMEAEQEEAEQEEAEPSTATDSSETAQDAPKKKTKN